MKHFGKLKQFMLPMVIVVLAILAIHSNALLNKSAFPLYKDNYQSYYGLIIGFLFIMINGSLINHYVYSAMASVLTASVGIYLKVYHYSLPTFKDQAAAAIFQSSLDSYLQFLKSYYWAMILLAAVLGLAGTFISKLGEKLDRQNVKSDNTFLNKNKIMIYMAIFTSIIAVFAIKMNISFGENHSVYNGLIVAIILCFLNGYIASNLRFAAFSGAAVALIGIYLKVNHYIKPYFKDQALMEAYQKEAFFPYIETLKQYFWLFTVGFVLVAVIGSTLGKTVEKISANAKATKAGKKTFLETRMMAYISIFVAISVVVNILRVGSLSFGGFPIIFSGFVLGPLSGFIVGALADVLSFIIRPSGPFNILFTLTSAMTGAIPILVVRLLGYRDKKLSLWKVLVGIAIGQLITSVILAPLFLAFFMGNDKGFLYFATKAFVKQALSVPIYAIILVSLHESLMRSGIRVEPAKRLENAN